MKILHLEELEQIITKALETAGTIKSFSVAKNGKDIAFDISNHKTNVKPDDYYADYVECDAHFELYNRNTIDFKELVNRVFVTANLFLYKFTEDHIRIKETLMERLQNFDKDSMLESVVFIVKGESPQILMTNCKVTSDEDVKVEFDYYISFYNEIQLYKNNKFEREQLLDYICNTADLFLFDKLCLEPKKK